MKKRIPLRENGQLSIPCRTSKRSKFAKAAAVLFYPVIAVGWLIACGLLLIDSANAALGPEGLPVKTAVTSSIALLLSLLCIGALIWLSVQSYALESREIALSPECFTVKNRRSCTYAWNEVGEVSIIAFAANAGRQRYECQICISFQTLTQKQLARLRRSYLYGAANLDKFILMDYSQTLADAVQTYSRRKITDHRHLQLCEQLW